jgi:nicotinate phosphoribosyltransferase
MPGALLTDLYELNMAASYVRRGMTDRATFSLFVRALPPNRGFLVAAGLESCLAFLEGFSFDVDDLAYLRDGLGFSEETLEAFGRMRFTGDAWAIPEGRIVFAREPLLEITAPLPEGQLAETYLLNQITFQTALASKAARCRIAAGPRDVVDFAFRRTHGVEAAMAVARTSAMVGFAATSNVEAARRYGLTAAGTMAHSFIEAFATEREAFQAFAEDFPERATFLVDTYDTLEGVRRATDVIRDLSLSAGLGIRLDSGDLDTLSRQARHLLDQAGLTEVRIFASGGLDELDVERLVRAGAPIDAFGVGTRMGVSADAPSLDSAYKLVAVGTRPVAKLSPGKASDPGAKQVFRLPHKEGDVVALRDEQPLPGAEALLRPLMIGGERTGPPEPLSAARERFEADLARLPAAVKRLREPDTVNARTSPRLDELSESVRADIRRAGPDL